MGIPSVPGSFLVSQGNGQVYISWNQSAGATEYILQRSTDNVTFTNLTVQQELFFLDTTVTVDTSYWYQVNAINADFASGYTDPQQTVPTLQGKYSLLELRTRAMQRADMVNSNFVTTSEWNYYINQSAQELYDLLITTYEDYYVSPRLLLDFDSNTHQYPLPNGQNLDGAPAFYKLYGVDIGLDASNTAYITLKKFSFIERNMYVFPQLQTSYLGVFNLRYRVIGNNLMLIPTPTNGLQVGIWYYPRLDVLIKDSDVLDGVSGWTEYVIVDAARKALAKEESDTQVLMQEKMALKMRIEESASNRDAGQPERIASTRGMGTGYGGDWNNGWNSPSAGF